MIALRRNHTRPIGLHWGPRSVTMVQLTGESENISVHAMAHAELPCAESTTATDQDRAIAQTLTRLVSDHRFRGRRVVSCLGADELFLQNVRLPQLPAEEAEKVVFWEAEERLPYPAQEAEIRHLTAGEVRQDANVKQEIILMACHRGALKRHIGILEQAGLVAEAIDVEPCAILRSFCRGSSDRRSRLAYLHLGEQATAVIFAEGEQLLFLKYVTGGGKHLDQAVAQHLYLPLNEAAEMRSTVMDSAELAAENEVHRSVIEAIRSPLESLSTEIELCLRYFKVTFRGKPLERIIISGTDASPWLVEFLSESLHTPCELGDPFQMLAHRPAAACAMGRPGRWATAVGLSLK